MNAERVVVNMLYIILIIVLLVVLFRLVGVVL